MPECKGTRLKKESLFFRIADRILVELAAFGYQGADEFSDRY